MRPISLAAATLLISSAALTVILPATAQDTQTLLRTVSVTSDPPGATIWKKEGNTLTCLDTITPGTVELKFHGINDLQRIRLWKFGYASRNLDIKPSDDEAAAALGNPGPGSFLVTEDAKPQLKQLSVDLENELEKGIFTDSEAFRCAPFELDFTRIMENDQTADLTLVVAVILDRGFGGAAFRLASRTGTQDERGQKAAKVALENGIADLLARFHRVAAKFPNLKVITIACSYSTTQAYLATGTIDTRQMSPVTVQRIVNTYNYSTGRWQDKITNVQEWRESGGLEEMTVVEHRPVEKVITIVIPLAQIPDTLDEKAISDAVLAKGKISLAESSDRPPKPHGQR
jgi:hypothetical protein